MLGGGLAADAAFAVVVVRPGEHLVFLSDVSAASNVGVVTCALVTTPLFLGGRLSAQRTIEGSRYKLANSLI